MVSSDLNLMVGSLQVVLSCLEGNLDRQQLLVPDCIIPFHCRQIPGIVGTWEQGPMRSIGLEEHGPDGYIRRINLHYKWLQWIKMVENGLGDEGGLDGF